MRYLARQYLDFSRKRYLSALLKGKKHAEFKPHGAKRFLCIQMHSIGDAIMSQAAWASLKAALPDSHLDLICRHYIAPLFRADPSLSHLYPLKSRRFRSWLFEDGRGVEEILIGGRYDLVIDFTEDPLTASLCAQRFCPPSIGFRRISDGAAKDTPIASAYDLTFPYDPMEPVRPLFMRLVSPWVVMPGETRSPVLYLDDLTLNKAMETLRNKELIPKRFIVAHPGAKWSPRRWPLEHWRRLITRLGETLPYPILLLGGSEDKELLHSIAGEKRSASLSCLASHETALSAALIKLAALCVCHDSGAMHIAAAVGTPSVALFGPGHPDKTAPPQKEGTHVLYSPMFCSPCEQYYARDRCRRGMNFCMYAISPERVFREIEDILSNEASKG
jgi:ADP-heptose:LPS heptosyltransferase